MSTPQQNYATNPDFITAPKSSAQAVNQGDLVKVASNLIVPIAAVTDTCFGVSENTSPVSSLGDLLDQIVVRRKGVFFFYLKAGDTVNFDTALYPEGSDPQLLTTSSGGGAVKVGNCRELASVLGAASNVTRIRVEFGS